jgi:hypothetical protein
MLPCRLSHQTVPNLLKPLLVFLLGQLGCDPLLFRGLAVAARLPQHEDKLNVVLDDGVRLVRLAEEARPVFYFVAGIRNFVPENRAEIVKSNLPSPHYNVCVHGHDRVAAVLAPRQTNVPDHADQTAAWDQHSETVLPNLLELVVEFVVTRNCTELAFSSRVLFEGPIWRRS